MPTILTREMFSITVDGVRAEIKVWRRPDLDSATGTRNALEVVAEGIKLPGRGVREIVLDMREAPAVAGPTTASAFEELMAAWGGARVRVAVLVSEDPVKTLQFRRLVTDNAPKNACVTTDAAEAATWLATSP